MLESKINSNSYHKPLNCFARFGPLFDNFIRCTFSNVIKSSEFLQFLYKSILSY